MNIIAIYSDNKDFADDLILQTAMYESEFMVSDDEDAVPDVVVVDENAAIFESIRARYKNIPLIFLSSDNKIAESRLNIAIKKPFSLIKFLDILRSANNKLDNTSDGYLTFGVYELHPLEKEIKNLGNGEIVKLTEKEVSIIKYLHKFSEVFINKNELQKNVWKYNEEVSTHTVETHIYRLRHKVEKNGAPQLILTDKGGYKLGTGK